MKGIRNNEDIVCTLWRHRESKSYKINKPLSQRIFTCEYCGYTVDRDINSAQNCYAYA